MVMLVTPSASTNVLMGSINGRGMSMSDAFSMESPLCAQSATGIVLQQAAMRMGEYVGLYDAGVSSIASEASTRSTPLLLQ